MARARNLKPGFFTDAELIECEHWVRLLFAGLWTIADRDGRLLDRPKQIGVDLFPRESLDIDAGLDTLADRGFIVRYEVDGQRIIWIKNFGSHQNPHKDERASTLPPPPSPEKHGAGTVQAPEEPGANRAISLNTDSLSLDSSPRISDCLEGAHDAPGADAPGADAPPKPKRPQQVPENWEPSADDRAWAEREGFSAADLERQLPMFRDHYRGQGKPMKDWAATWRNWMRRSRDDPRFAPRSRASPNGHVSGGSFSEAARRHETPSPPEPAGSIDALWRPR